MTVIRMWIKIHILTWISLGLLLWSKSNCTAEIDWTKENPHSDVSCPSAAECWATMNNSTKPLTSTKSPCCIECLCDRKCFDNQTGHDFTGMYDCLEPHTHVNDTHDLALYIFVSRPPLDGCVKTQSRTGTPRPSCNPAVMAAPWGNFYPVYSFDKQINFINENCARCHGATDIIKWDTFLLYWGTLRTVTGTIRNYGRMFNDEDILNIFEPPNMASKEYRNKCFLHKDSCPTSLLETFYVPSNVNMSRSEIVDACENGPSSLYKSSSRKTFKNTFCAICNGLTSKAFDSIKCTIPLDDDGGRAMTGATLVMLLKNSYMESWTNRPGLHESSTGNVVCVPRKNKSESVVCRDMICPTFQVRFPGGRCDYPISSIYVDFLFVSVNLTSPDYSDRQHILNLTTDQVKSIFNKFNPLSACWKLRIIGFRVDVHAINRTEFVVTLSCGPAKSFDIQNTVKILLSTLSKQWVLDVNGRKGFSMGFNSNDEVFFNGKDLVPKWTRRYNTSLNVLDLPIPIWTALYTDNNFYRGPVRGKKIQNINKLFYCDQVELTEDEYQIINGIFLLYLIRNDKYLYPGEYIDYKGEDGNQVVTVCLEDSGFVPDGSGKNAISFEQRFLVQVLSFAFSVFWSLLRISLLIC